MTRGDPKPQKVGQKKRRAQRRGHSVRDEASLNAITTFLVGLVPITLEGNSTRVPALHAIILRLLQQSLKGNDRAWRTLMKYLKFAKAGTKTSPELVFVDSDYTRAFAADPTDNAID